MLHGTKIIIISASDSVIFMDFIDLIYEAAVEFCRSLKLDINKKNHSKNLKWSPNLKKHKH